MWKVVTITHTYETIDEDYADANIAILDYAEAMTDSMVIAAQLLRDGDLIAEWERPQ